MALLNFGAESQVKLGKILGSFDTTIQERVVRSQTGYIENQYFQVTEQVDIEGEGEEESSTEFKAIEVQPNGTPVENGIVFDSDATPSTNVADPIYLPNLKFNSELFSGSVEVGKAYTVEEVDSDTFGEASDWFIIPKGGAGGDVKARIEILSDTSISQGGVIQVNIVDLEGAVIIPNTQAVQYKFELSKFYAGEIVYGDLTTNKNGGSYYLLDPYLAGVGGNSAE